VWFVALFVGALIWLGYVYATAVIELGLCGTGVRGVRVGWTHENGSYIVAAVIGAVLWAAGVFATSRSPRRKWLILGVYGIAYVGALILFATAIAPAIWGAASCELY
jgi:hypothetical protein